MARTKRLDTFRAPKPTIVDVARHAGVSAATVSYVLNGRFSQVSEKTIDKVRLAVQDLGYVKNLTASALSSRRSNMIGVLLPDLLDPASREREPEINPFYGEFIFLLEAEARARGYALCLFAGRERDAIEFLLQRHLEAAVLVGFCPPNLQTLLDQKGIKLVAYDSFRFNPGVRFVRTDEEHGGALAAEHLLSLGRQRPVFLGGFMADFPDHLPAYRCRGARAVFAQADIPMQILEGPTSYSAGLEAAEAVVRLGGDCVVAVADIIAAGLIEGLRQLGRSVPDDIAVTGYDNLPISRHVRPQITTVDQRLPQKIAALMASIEEETTGDPVVVAPRLLVRESA